MGESTARQTKNVKKSKVPTDLGLLPGIMITNPWHSYYKLIWSDPKLWLRLSFTLAITPIRTPLRNWVILRFLRGSWYNRNMGELKKPEKLPLQLSGRIRTALELHHDLNKAIASGDMTWLQQNACSGLRDQAQRLIDRRKRAGSAAESWDLSAYPGLRRAWVPPWPWCSLIPEPFRAYRVMADMSAGLPFGYDSILRQVVVRIKSTQTFNKQTGMDPQTKTLTEYVVIQQLVWEGKPGEWRIWGTLKPSTIEEIKDTYKTAREQEGSFADRMKAALPPSVSSSLPF